MRPVGVARQWLAGAVLVALLPSGCCIGLHYSQLKPQAAYDHQCPKEQVHIVETYPDIVAFVLDVCGERRKYRLFRQSFVDVTDGPLRTHPGVDPPQQTRPSQ